MLFRSSSPPLPRCLARLTKVEIAMANTWEGVDLIEQDLEKGLKDIREQIKDLCEGVLVSQV